MPKSPDEFDSPQEPSESSEKKPQREIFREIARTQMDCLGYSNLVEELTAFFKGQGAIAEFVQKIPGISGGNETYIYGMVHKMKRVPNSNQASELLITAIFGEPKRRYEDETVITSFTVAEPSTTIVQSKFTMLRDKEDNPRYMANVKGTDALIRNLISKSGFLEKDKTVETIFQLKKTKRISLPHLSIKSLSMEIEGPTNAGKRNTKTAYSYNVKTIIKDNQA